MTDKEKIKAEIERLFTNYSSENTIFAAGVRHTLISLKSFIDSLPEEPVSEDLESAAQIWWEKVRLKSDLSGMPINAFKAGAQWANKNPDKNSIVDYLYKEGGYAVTLNGNLVTKDEEIESLYNFYQYKVNRFITEASKWLENQAEFVGVSFQKDFIERFKEDMQTILNTKEK